MDPLISQLALGCIVMGIWSSLYKPNIIFEILTSIIVGYTCAHGILTAYTNIDRYDIQPLIKGDYTILVPIIWGLLTYTFFTRRYRDVYRACIFFTLVISLGQFLPARMDTFERSVLNWVKQATGSDPMMLVYMAILCLTLLYFVYWKRFEDTVGKSSWFDKVRLVTRCALFAYVGYAVGMNFLKFSVITVGITQSVQAGAGMYIVGVAAILLLFDIFVGWSKILRPSKATETTSSTS